jgi:hypothetical protein
VATWERVGQVGNGRIMLRGPVGVKARLTRPFLLGFYAFTAREVPGRFMVWVPDLWMGMEGSQAWGNQRPSPLYLFLTKVTVGDYNVKALNLCKNMW